MKKNENIIKYRGRLVNLDDYSSVVSVLSPGPDPPRTRVQFSASEWRILQMMEPGRRREMITVPLEGLAYVLSVYIKYTHLMNEVLRELET